MTLYLVNVYPYEDGDQRSYLFYDLDQASNFIRLVMALPDGEYLLGGENPGIITVSVSQSAGYALADLREAVGKEE